MEYKIINTCPYDQTELTFLNSNFPCEIHNYIGIYKCNTCNHIFKEENKAIKKTFLDYIFSKEIRYRKEITDLKNNKKFEKLHNLIPM